jgi:hypothetical protein
MQYIWVALGTKLLAHTALWRPTARLLCPINFHSSASGLVTLKLTFSLEKSRISVNVWWRVVKDTGNCGMYVLEITNLTFRPYPRRKLNLRFLNIVFSLVQMERPLQAANTRASFLEGRRLDCSARRPMCWTRHFVIFLGYFWQP